MRQRQDLDGRISNVRRLEQTLADNVELIELGEEEGDDDIVAEAEAVIRKLGKEAAKLELETLLSGEADSNDAYLFTQVEGTYEEKFLATITSANGEAQISRLFEFCPELPL